MTCACPGGGWSWLLFFRKDGCAATLIIEIHVSFRPAPVVTEGAYPFPRIDVIEDFLHGVEEEGVVEVFDDSEEYASESAGVRAR